MDSIIDLVGYIAASLVFAAFYVKKISTLRVIAIGSNIAFIIYGFGQELYPIFILHSMLLPLNSYRLLEIKRNSIPHPEVPCSRRIFSINTESNRRRSLAFSRESEKTVFID